MQGGSGDGDGWNVDWNLSPQPRSDFQDELDLGDIPNGMAEINAGEDNSHYNAHAVPEVEDDLVLPFYNPLEEWRFLYIYLAICPNILIHVPPIGFLARCLPDAATFPYILC